jgi:hypothetical protein
MDVTFREALQAEQQQQEQHQPQVFKAAWEAICLKSASWQQQRWQHRLKLHRLHLGRFSLFYR